MAYIFCVLLDRASAEFFFHVLRPVIQQAVYVFYDLIDLLGAHVYIIYGVSLYIIIDIVGDIMIKVFIIFIPISYWNCIL